MLFFGVIVSGGDTNDNDDGTINGGSVDPTVRGTFLLDTDCRIDGGEHNQHDECAVA